MAIVPAVRRSQLAIDAARHNHEQRTRVGAEVQVMRERRAGSRIELARRAGLGRMVVRRVERGATNFALDVLQRILALDRHRPRERPVECSNTIGDVGATALVSAS